VLVSGVAGLLAGAFSMAAGEYVSVRSQREMFEHQIGAERDELAKYPDEEARSCRSSIRRAG
jgi:VIT1/CCC1 family predicted Fe2+/Mn2+ transporter